MAWKGDGSGRKDSAKGGVSGSKGGGGKGGSGNGGGRTSPKAVGNATVADHAIATGRVSAPSIPSGGVARGNYNSQVDAYNDYSKAVGEFETRGLLGRALDFIGGPLYDQQEPMAGNPRSFAGGTFHSSTNPGGLLGSLAPYGMGNVFGPLASKAYTSLGLPQAWHGGYDQPDLRNGVFGNTQSAMGGTLADAADRVSSGGFGPGGAPNMSGGGTGQGGINYQGQLASQGMLGAAPPKPAAAPALPAQQIAPQSQIGKYLSTPGLMAYGVNSPGYRHF
jgi:hypothetical protein